MKRWTRRRLFFLSLVLVACGVSAQAARLDLLTAVPPPTAFSRAVNVLTTFGYTVEDADRESGFIRAELRSGSVLSPSHWGLTVMLVPDSGGTRLVLQPTNLGDRGTFGEGRILGKQQTHVDSVATRLRAVLESEAR